jgi:hypothetical protein
VAATREDYEGLLSRLDDDDLADGVALDISRQLVELEPERVDGWWAMASALAWSLGERRGSTLRDDTRFDEMLRAYDRVIELDGTDAAAPYNKARMLARADRFADAYQAYMLAGRTESAHPRADIDWPAAWHYEQAAEMALRAGDAAGAQLAAEAAIGAGDVDDADAAELIARLRSEM